LALTVKKLQAGRTHNSPARRYSPQIEFYDSDRRESPCCKIIGKTFFILPFQRQLHLHSTKRPCLLALPVALAHTDNYLSNYFFYPVSKRLRHKLSLHGYYSNMLQTCRLVLTSIYGSHGPHSLSSQHIKKDAAAITMCGA
jgi:hypothetical protein